MNKIQEMAFSKGDIIINKRYPNTERRVVAVFISGYLWEYLDTISGDNNLFDSRNSTDPNLINWELKTTK